MKEVTIRFWQDTLEKLQTLMILASVSVFTLIYALKTSLFMTISPWWCLLSLVFLLIERIFAYLRMRLDDKYGRYYR